MPSGEAYAFINYDQAARFGHLGWGFRISPDRYYFGSTDHLWRTEYPFWHPIELLRYMTVAPGDNNDFWAQSGSFSQMLQTMVSGHHIRYQFYKLVPVKDPRPEIACNFADSFTTKGWSVLFDNCVHHTHSILQIYGGEGLPSPHKLPNRLPRTWFAEIPSPRVSIHSEK